MIAFFAYLKRFRNCFLLVVLKLVVAFIIGNKFMNVAFKYNYRLDKFLNSNISRYLISIIVDGQS